MEGRNRTGDESGSTPKGGSQEEKNGGEENSVDAGGIYRRRNEAREEILENSLTPAYFVTGIFVRSPPRSTHKLAYTFFSARNKLACTTATMQQ